MSHNLSHLALAWVIAPSDTIPSIDSEFYCGTRDLFQARLDKMTRLLSSKHILPESELYLIAALAGEIGNNSFDHNIGNWPDVPGIFFSYHVEGADRKIVLADRGQGVLKTLKKVKPSLESDEQALETAFKERLSGRAPENRGNGLKFVLQTVQDQKLHLTFSSGSAQVVLNDAMVLLKADPFIHGCLAILSF